MAMLWVYQDALAQKYRKVLENRWFWLVFALIMLVGVFAYGFYCTSRGYNFTGNIKLHWPRIWEMGIGCSK